MIDTIILLTGIPTALGIYLTFKAFMGDRIHRVNKESKLAPFLNKRHRLLTDRYGIATITHGKMVDRSTGKVCLSLLPEHGGPPVNPYYYLDEIEPVDKLDLLLGGNLHKLKGVEIGDRELKVIEVLKKNLEEKDSETKSLQAQLHGALHHPERHIEKATETAERLIKAKAKGEEWKRHGTTEE